MSNFKIDYLDGCNYSMDINGTEFVDLSRTQQQELCHKIIDSDNILKRILVDFMEGYLECDCNNLPEEYKKTLPNDDYYNDINIDKIYAKDINVLKTECNTYIDNKDCSEATLQELVAHYAETCGKEYDLGHCSTCGSWNFKYVAEV